MTALHFEVMQKIVSPFMMLKKYAICRLQKPIELSFQVLLTSILNMFSKIKALVLVAHPHLGTSVANKLISDQLQNTENITVHNLYDQYPYFHVDVKREQNLILEHDLIVFQHPFFWYNMPPLLKMWMDEVLTSGFAYGTHGDKLKNKSFLLSITAGGETSAYNSEGYHQHSINQFLTGYKQTAQLCQMKWLEPFVLFGSRRSDLAEIQKHADNLKNFILQYKD